MLGFHSLRKSPGVMTCSQREWLGLEMASSFPLGVLRHMVMGFLGIVVEDSNTSSQVTAQYVLKVIQQRGVRNSE